ncbi:type II secretion system F family protein [Nocardia sp. NBC_00416]|uniref:type II secretion system F family protein n=1 Tax=Nocardia sp. NBC_00416 TaxID=2975991 RepID=UPI002E23C69D
MIAAEPAAALGCTTLALLLIPDPVGRRRFGAVFGAGSSRRRFPKRSVACGAAGAGCALALTLGSGSLMAVLIVVGTAAVRLRRSRRASLHRTECGFLLDGLEAVISELRVGAHPSAAAAAAARETSGIAAAALAIGSARSRLGGSGADGLLHSDAVIAAELRRVADAWQVAERHGLALAELLAAARADLAARVRFRSRTDAALAGARATAAILAVLPVLGIGLGQLMGANPLQVLFVSPAGRYLLPLGTGLACAGLLWADEITRRVVPR